MTIVRHHCVFGYSLVRFRWPVIEWIRGDGEMWASSINITFHAWGRVWWHIFFLPWHPFSNNAITNSDQ